ncbi:HNH endonuclease [Haloplanus vescus]|uniref:HNH endonuclease n=2 Tax=Haloplanus vescus TaxID=555874 RepID=A0A1H3VVS7_9EURY|nr:HNH endonuclease [Haloplanus vescus]
MARGNYPPDWDERRRRVYQRDNYTCQLCGRGGGPHGNLELHAHHRVPISQGGSHDLSNLTTLCRECHNRQHDHDITESPGPNPSAGGGVIEIVLAFTLYHLVIPVGFVVAYLYVLSTVLDTVGGIHMIVTIAAIVAVGVTGGLIGLNWPAVVVKGYGIVIASTLLVFYVGGPTGMVEELGSIVAEHSLLEVVLAIPSVIFGLMGPLLVILFIPVFNRLNSPDS